MPSTKKAAGKPKPAKPTVPMIPPEYVGKWIAWAPDGVQIVAVASSHAACIRAAGRAGYAENRVAFEKVPTTRQRVTGSFI
jgi:hypothetical protein